MRVAADAVLDQQPVVVVVADGSVEPGPGGVHHHGGHTADDLGDGDAVAHLGWWGAPGAAHGPRAWPGITRSATTGPGARSSPTSTATGSCCCRRALPSTLARTCQAPATAQVALPPHCLRHTTAGRMACSARQLVACTPGWTRKVNSASR